MNYMKILKIKQLSDTKPLPSKVQKRKIQMERVNHLECFKAQIRVKIKALTPFFDLPDFSQTFLNFRRRLWRYGCSLVILIEMKQHTIF